MFKPGEKIHTHDGKVYTVRKNGRLPKMGRMEVPRVRGFVRGQLVDCETGAVSGDGGYYENTITVFGHQQIVRGFVGLASNASTGFATVTSDMAFGRVWAVGSITAPASDLSTKSALDSEYGYSSGASTGTRVNVSSQLQQLSGTWSLTQTFSWASSSILANAAINCVAQHYHTAVGTGSALSFGTFAAVTKSSNQALNITYGFVFST